MSSRIFQNVIIQMKDAIDRTIGLYHSLQRAVNDRLAA